MTQQEYAYYQQLRRRQIYNHYLHHQHMFARLQNLRYAKKAGIDVEHDPGYREEYLAMVTEFGKCLFVFEDSKQKVIRKENGVERQ